MPPYNGLIQELYERIDCDLGPQLRCNIFATNHYNGEVVNVFVEACAVAYLSGSQL